MTPAHHVSSASISLTEPGEATFQDSNSLFGTVEHC